MLAFILARLNHQYPGINKAAAKKNIWMVWII